MSDFIRKSTQYYTKYVHYIIVTQTIKKETKLRRTPHQQYGFNKSDLLLKKEKKL